MLPQDSYLNAHQIKKSGSAATPAASGSSLAAVHLRRASVAAKANQPPGLRRFHSWDRTGVQYLVDLPQGTGGYGGEYRDMMWIEFDGIFKKNRRVNWFLWISYDFWYGNWTHRVLDTDSDSFEGHQAYWDESQRGSQAWDTVYSHSWVL